MNGVLLCLLLLADEPSYPLGRLPERSLAEPGRPLVLTDLSYRLTKEPGIVQAFAARARIGTWGFVAGEVDDQRRELSLQTHRLDLRFFEDGSFTNLQGGWRGGRTLLDLEAERRPPQDGSGWVLDGQIGLRLSANLEGFVTVLRDTDGERPLPARTVRAEGLSLLWQRGTRLDLSGSVSRETARTPAGFDLDTLRLAAGALGYAWSSEAGGEWGYERTRGPLPRNQAFGSAAVRSVVKQRLLVQADSRNRWEPGVSWLDHELGFGLSLHARRIRQPRAGEAAVRTLALARRATSLGDNERRVYDEDGRRALRERLALSPRRADLAADSDALHREQIAERSVPLAGISVAEQAESVNGVRRRSLDAFLGLPWPMRWPWQRDEAAVPFLTARYVLVRTRFGALFSSSSHTASLLAELNREMSILLRWRRPGVTALDVSFRTGRARSWELEYAYSFGR